MLAQPDFDFVSVGEKVGRIERYQNLIMNRDQTRQTINMIKDCIGKPELYENLTKNLAVFQDVFNTLDKHSQEFEVL